MNNIGQKRLSYVVAKKGWKGGGAKNASKGLGGEKPGEKRCPTLSANQQRERASQKNAAKKRKKREDFSRGTPFTRGGARKKAISGGGVGVLTA